MFRSTGRHGTLAARLHRLERDVGVADCAVCGGASLLVLGDGDDPTRMMEDGRCRGCGAPMKVLKGIDTDAI